MEIKYAKQIEIDEIADKEIDLFLFAGNHEKRVFSAYNKCRSSYKIIKSIVLCYNETFINKVQCVEQLVISDNSQIYDLLDLEFSKFSKKGINIIIDYSCMTKPWYYSIILYLSKKVLCVNKINAYFTYTPSKYSEPKDPKPNSEIAPLPGKYVVPTNKPKALIVCLGYEQNKAEGIIDHLDPKISYIFYTKPALDGEFVKTLEVNNKNVLDGAQEKIITYPFDDLLYLERELTSIYYLLKDKYSITIAPLGPKPFTFIAMLMSVKHNDIDIWRVGSGSDINEYEREPFEDEKFIVSEVVFEN